ncbi:MAG: MerR family DNA-binding transcriptional regulator [Gomphosphaeria aponina SAG 52.96 = DSM 107014]|uniref:MerR family DNA-binding transcriptional regulator n=1 Tax=Gomphosphaeria aponina SAG 52.96 = DSM 107014 TaxID=1521640 RepID=A0A941GNN3_9CHRO|nr:MerR family DNA-binding transcriptional regulator [Gomphosphaeria aponina SAG 52.96 = DSM 107014]
MSKKVPISEASKILGVAQATLRRWEDEGKITPTRTANGHFRAEEVLFPMPYAVDNEYFQEKAKQAHENREAFRQSLGLEQGRPIILFAAKLIDKKRPHDLLSALL